MLELRATDAAGNVGQRIRHGRRRPRGARQGIRFARQAAPGRFGPPPANDLFAAAQRISELAADAPRARRRSRRLSSREPDAHHSVWFSWRAPASGHARARSRRHADLDLHAAARSAALQPVAAARCARRRSPRTAACATGSPSTASRRCSRSPGAPAASKRHAHARSSARPPRLRPHATRAAPQQ